MTADLPGALLFACTHNVIRSPMAAAIARHFYGKRTFIASCGELWNEAGLACPCMTTPFKS